MNTKIPPEKKALQRAAEVLGGQAALASILGYEDRRNVWPWFNTGRRFPAEHCPAVERATRERGQVVLCEELRPDVDWAYLRMVVAPTAAAEPQWDGKTDRRSHTAAGR